MIVRLSLRAVLATASCALFLVSCGSGGDATPGETGPAIGSSELPVVTDTVPPAESTGASGASVAAPTTTTTTDAVVAIEAVFQEVAFYPACGNETLEHLGRTWSTVVDADGTAMDPALERLATELLAPPREPSPVGDDIHGLARVVAPGPGDDVGTLVVWADGVARWVSDSGDLDVWLTDQPVAYTWVC